ncbi:phage protein U [Paenibacillus mucilaginosus]|uniref:CIS tube protein n=1 Tax=Paenibacillus mucilaginosus TaxID=61624 RepID=UPI003D1BBD69
MSNIQKPIKAQIFVIGTKETVKVLFNPNEYTINGGNSFSTMKSSGDNSRNRATILQYLGSQEKVLTLDLFFDTSLERTNVRSETQKIVRLMNARKSMNWTPPVVSFVWGRMGFRGVVEKVTEKYTMFLSNGTPVRATLNVTFRACASVIKKESKNTEEAGAERNQHVSQTGERLSSISLKEFQSSSEWRKIAEANGIDNPRAFKSGIVLIIPRLE